MRSLLRLKVESQWVSEPLAEASVNKPITPIQGSVYTDMRVTFNVAIGPGGEGNSGRG